MLEGRPQEISRERDRQLEAARELRQLRRQQRVAGMARGAEVNGCRRVKRKPALLGSNRAEGSPGRLIQTMTGSARFTLSRCFFTSSDG